MALVNKTTHASDTVIDALSKHIDALARSFGYPKDVTAARREAVRAWLRNFATERKFSPFPVGHISPWSSALLTSAFPANSAVCDNDGLFYGLLSRLASGGVEQRDIKPAPACTIIRYTHSYTCAPGLDVPHSILVSCFALSEAARKQNALTKAEIDREKLFRNVLRGSNYGGAALRTLGNNALVRGDLASVPDAVQRKAQTKNAKAAAAAATNPEVVRPTKRGVVISRMNRPEEIGDTAFDAECYHLTADVKSAPPKRDVLVALVCGRDGAAYTMSDFTNVAFDVPRMYTPWSAMAVSPAIVSLSPYTNAFPCACTAELLANIASVAKTVHASALNHATARKQTLDANAWDTLSTLVHALVLGSIPTSLTNNKEFANYISLNSTNFGKDFQARVIGALKAVTADHSWMPPNPTMPHMPSAKPNYIEPSERQYSINRWWAHTVAAMESQPSYAAMERSQQWHFVPVKYTNTLATLTKELFAAKYYFRAAELAAIAAFEGTSSVASSCMQAIIFDAPSVWPCDVCLSTEIAVSALRVRSVAVGVPVVISATKTVVALPHRQWVAGASGSSITTGASPIDAMVFGTMLSALNSTTPPVCGHELLYPFAFIALVAAPLAYDHTIQTDEQRNLVPGQGVAYHRAPAWLGVLCAAVKHIYYVFNPVTTTSPSPLSPPSTMAPLEWSSFRAQDGWLRTTLDTPFADAIKVYQKIARLYSRAAGITSRATVLSFSTLALPLATWVLDETCIAPKSIIAKLCNCSEDALSSPHIIGGKHETSVASHASANSAMVDLLLDRAIVSDDIVVTQVLSALHVYNVPNRLSPETTAYQVQLPVRDLSIGDGNSGALPPWKQCIPTLEQEHDVPHDYSDAYDGNAVPSLALMASLFVSSLPRCNADGIHVDGLRCDELLKTIAYVATSHQQRRRTETKLPTMSTFAESIRSTYDAHQRGVPPLAVRTCDGSLITPRDSLLVANNQFAACGCTPDDETCPRPCNGCNNPRVFASASSAVIPKNSRLLADIIHYRRGAVVLHHACPRKADLGATHEYTESVLASIITAKPLGSIADVAAPQAPILRTTHSRYDDEVLVDIQSFGINQFGSFI